MSSSCRAGTSRSLLAALGKTQKAADSETLDDKDSAAFLASDAAAPLEGYEIQHASSGLNQQVTSERTVSWTAHPGRSRSTVGAA